MINLKIIQKIADKAKKDTPPNLDVSSTVMYQISQLQPPNTSYLPFDLIAALSALTASLITILSIGSWFSILNPFLRLFTPLQEIPLW